MSLPSAVCLTGVRSAGIGIASVGSCSVGRWSSEARRRRGSLLVCANRRQHKLETGTKDGKHGHSVHEDSRYLRNVALLDCGVIL